MVVNINADNIKVVYDGNPHTAKYTIGTITSTNFKEEYIGYTGELSITATDVTKQSLDAHFFVKEEYAGNFKNVTINVQQGGLEITKRPLTITTPGKTTIYPTPATTGQLADADARAAVQGWVDGEGGKLGECNGIKYNVIDEGDLIDEEGNHYFENTVAAPVIIFDNGTKESNYEIDWKNSKMGKLIVKPRPITVKATGHISDPIPYDGDPHTESGYDVEVLSDDPDDLAYRVSGDTLDYQGPSQTEISATETESVRYPLGLKED